MKKCSFLSTVVLCTLLLGINAVAHAAPAELDPPPAEWEPVFNALAKECSLRMKIEEGFTVVSEFTEMLEP
jgi:hypothetical protein